MINPVNSAIYNLTVVNDVLKVLIAMESAILSFGVIADTQFVDVDDEVTNELAYVVKTNGEYVLQEVKEKSVRRYRQSLEILKVACTDYGSFSGSSGEKLTFCMHLGDVIDAKSGVHRENSFNECIQRVLECIRPLQDSGIDWHFCVGNNDVKAMTRECWFDSFSSPRFGCSPQKLYYEFSPLKGYRFIVLDPYDVSTILWSPPDYSKATSNGFENLQKFSSASCSDSNEEALRILRDKSPSVFEGDWYKDIETRGLDIRFMPYNGKVGTDQVAWLHEILERSDDDNEKVWIFSHLPIHEKVCRLDGLLWNYDELISILRSYSCVQAYFAGHDHDGGYVIDNYGIHHVVPPAPLECDKDQTSFGYVHIFEVHLIQAVYYYRLCFTYECATPIP